MRDIILDISSLKTFSIFSNLSSFLSSYSRS